jgi:hypothetical protein
MFDADRVGVVPVHESAWAFVSNEAKSLVCQLLQLDPHKRVFTVAVTHLDCRG